MRDREALHLAPEVLAAVDDRARHHAVLQDPPFGVDVVQEQVQRREALGQAALDEVPFRGRQDPREEVEGEDPLGAVFRP